MKHSQQYPTSSNNQLAAKAPYSVSQLTRTVRLLLEDGFPNIWVEGEISNLSKPGSGHLYLTLKDDRSQIRCAMFRSRNVRMNFSPKNGDQVLVRGKISLYEARGDFQLIIDSMEETGDGALKRAFEALKYRLNQEGLFDTRFKQPLPALPQRIGVVTSPTGAAIADILSVLKRRFPAIPVTVYATQVQGEAAAAAIVQRIQQANQDQTCDLLIVGRGGGSLEDLWAFNEESVVRAVFDSRIPIISAVGHEVDTTLCDLVADQRAATPSAAAELACPDQHDFLSRIRQLHNRLVMQIDRQLNSARQHTDNLTLRLQQQHPSKRLQQQQEHLNRSSAQLNSSMKSHIEQLVRTLENRTLRLNNGSPANGVVQRQQQLQSLTQRLQVAQRQRLQTNGEKLASCARALEAVSPLKTLARGYSITRDQQTQAVISSAEQVTMGQTLEHILEQGTITSQVTEIINEKP